MARSSSSRSIKAAIKPYQKESTYTNIFPFPVLLWIFGYVCFNFWMEWQNWDKLLENASLPPPENVNATTFERWMVVDVNNNALSECCVWSKCARTLKCSTQSSLSCV